MLDYIWTQAPNDYPTSDGKPVAETDIHRELMFESIDTLKNYFKDHPLVYVTGNILWFYQPGDRRRHISPDLMVCFGIPKGVRDNYLQWQEVCPQVVIEFTSKSTRTNDLGSKRERYETLGVEEYYLFDPRQEYLKPRFRTFHRHHGRFVRVLGETVHSNMLGLELLVIDETLRFRDPVTGQILLTTANSERARADREAARANQEAALRVQEGVRADQEATRANQEAFLRKEAERQLAEMRALLEQREDG